VRRLDEVARHRMASRSWVVRQAIADFLAGPGAARGGAVVGEDGRAAPSD
jgi:predicted transcriptional regulator